MRRMVEQRMDQIQALVRQVCGQGVRVELSEDEPAPEPPGDPSGARPAGEPAAPGWNNPQLSAAAEDPLVKRTAELFGATIVRIEPKETPDGR